MGPVGWANYVVAQSVQAFAGLIGPDVTDIAVEWVDDAVVLHVAAGSASDPLRDDLNEVMSVLDGLLGGAIPVRLLLREGPGDDEWSGYRHRRIFGRRR